ncbi:hypothetical protein DFJ63DRAFT_310450 [Scheffersomyces coipomensis]|uniref:uncharacterized protein n=1 Tax=Scheffersomyces coipomensis TaxID=1788519 RepID=UPI00315CD48F
MEEHEEEKELDDAYLWQMKSLSAEEIDAKFPKSALALMIFRTSDCIQSIEQVFSDFNKFITIFRHHYPYRWDYPRLQIKNHGYKKFNKSKKRNMTRYIYCELIYDDSINDRNVIQDVLFKFCTDHSVFAQVFDSMLAKSSFESEDKNLQNQVWVVGDKVVKLDIPEDELNIYSDRLPLATAIGYMMKNKYYVDEANTFDILTRISYERTPFDDLSYVVEIDGIMEPKFIAMFNENPHLVCLATTAFLNEGLTLDDFKTKEINAKPFKFSIGYLSYQEMLCLYKEKQKELIKAQNNLNSISFNSVVFQILGRGLGTAMYDNPDVILLGNPGKPSEGFNTRNLLQDKLISNGYMEKEIPQIVEIIDEDSYQSGPIDMKYLVREKVIHLFSSHSPTTNTTNLVDDINPDQPLLLDTHPKILSNPSDLTNGFVFKKVCPELSENLQEQRVELFHTYMPQTTDSDEILKLLLRFLKRRKTIAERYDNRSKEFIYLERSEGLVQSRCYPTFTKYSKYYHREINSRYRYFDLHKLSQRQVEDRYKDVTTIYYDQAEDDDLYRQSHTYEDYNDNEIKYINLMRKRNNELQNLINSGNENKESDTAVHTLPLR